MSLYFHCATSVDNTPRTPSQTASNGGINSVIQQVQGGRVQFWWTTLDLICKIMLMYSPPAQQRRKSGLLLQTSETALDLAIGTVDMDFCMFRSGEPTPPFSLSGVPRSERLARNDAAQVCGQGATFSVSHSICTQTLTRVTYQHRLGLVDLRYSTLLCHCNFSLLLQAVPKRLA